MRPKVYAALALVLSGLLRAAAFVALVLFLAQAVGLDVVSWRSVLLGFVASAACFSLSKMAATSGVRKLARSSPEWIGLQKTIEQLRAQIEDLKYSKGSTSAPGLRRRDVPWTERVNRAGFRDDDGC